MFRDILPCILVVKYNSILRYSLIYAYMSIFTRKSHPIVCWSTDSNILLAFQQVVEPRCTSRNVARFLCFTAWWIWEQAPLEVLELSAFLYIWHLIFITQKNFFEINTILHHIISNLMLFDFHIMHLSNTWECGNMESFAIYGLDWWMSYYTRVLCTEQQPKYHDFDLPRRC